MDSEKKFPKINFLFVEDNSTIARERQIRLDRFGVREVLGNWERYETKGEFTIWHNEKGDEHLYAYKLTPKEIDDFINDDILPGGGALFGGMLLGGLAATALSPYRYPVYQYPGPHYSGYPYYPSYYPGYSSYPIYSGYRRPSHYSHRRRY